MLDLGGFPNYNTGFPDSFIPPADKGKMWHMQFAQAAFSNNFINTYMTGMYDQWRLNRLFAQGRQPISRYVKILCGEGVQAKGDTGQKSEQKGHIVDPQEGGANFMNINWRVVSVMPKIRDSVINYVNKAQFRADFNATNPEALDEKRSIKNMMWAEKVLKDDLDEIEKIGNIKLSGRQDTSWIPDEHAEFEALANVKVKIAEEIKAELACGQVFEDNEWDITSRRLDESGFDLAFESLECRTNRFTGKIDVNYVDPETLIMPTFTGKTGEDIWVIGTIEQISLYQLYQEAGDQYTPEEYRLIAEVYRARFNNTWDMSFDWTASVQNNFAAWKSWKILRQKVYWYDTNVKRWSSTKVGDKDESYRWREYDKAPKNTVREGNDGVMIKTSSGELQAQVVRECMWVVGTQYIHNWGILKDISRDQMDKRQSFLPIKIYHIAEQSRVERAIPFLDNICLTWYRMQDRIARGIPPGITINLDAFEKLVIDQKNWSTQKLLDLAVQSGIIFHRTIDSMLPENGGSGAAPITPHEGSGIGILAEYTAVMDNSIEKVKEVTGISDIVDGTTPEPKTGLGVAKMNYNSVINSLSELIFARQYLFEKTALDVAGKMQLKSNTGDYEMYVDSVGEIVKFKSSFSLSRLGINAEAVPTDQDKQNMKLMLSQALQTTQTPLDFDDLYYINNLIDNCKSLKLAERLINVRIQARRTQKAQEAQGAQQMTGQQALQQQQQKTSDAKDLLDYEYGLKKDYESHLTGEIQARNAGQSQNRIDQTVVRSSLKKDEMESKAMLEDK